MKLKFLAAVAIAAGISTSATKAADVFTINLSAGQLVLDGSTGLISQALLLILQSGADGTFSEALTPGQYVSGDDTILGAAAFTTVATNETQNIISITVPFVAGQAIALRWFADINYTQYNNGVLTDAGDHYGTYSAVGTPDGGNLWIVPVAGSTIDLNFFTTNSDGGGTQVPSEGYASSTVTAIPEPTTLALGALGAGAFFFLRRRRA